MSNQFLSLPSCNLSDADVIILPVPHEKTVTYNKGTSLAPQAILAASQQLEFFEEDRAWCPFEYLKVHVHEPVEPVDDEDVFHQALHDTVKTFSDSALFIGLGGEHSITPDMLFARMPDGGTVVQIDAHADFRPSYHGSEYNHACPMYRIRQKDYQLIQIGIRSLHANEAKAIAADEQVTTYLDRDLQKPEHWHQLLTQLQGLSGDVYLTIDMDGFDPGIIGGVGTPQPGGISWHQGLDILDAITQNPQIRLCGADVVELIPEPSCVSDMLAAKLVQKIISYWGKSIGADQGEPNGSQLGAEDD